MSRQDDIDDVIEEVLAEVSPEDVVFEVDLEAELAEAISLLRLVASARGWRELDSAQKQVRAFLDQVDRD